VDFAAQESVHAVKRRRASLVIALPWPVGRAVGGGSAGIGPGCAMMEAIMSKIQHAKLSDAQA